MRFKALLATLFVAGLAVSVAVAHPPPGKGKGKRDSVAASSTAADSTSGSTSTSTTTAESRPGKAKGKRDKSACHPTVSFILKGDYVSGAYSATGEGSFAMLVKKANKHGRQYVGMQVTIEVGAYTKVKRRGKATVSQLAAGDKLVVHVRGCKVKGDAAAASAPKLYAKHVNAKGPKADDGDSEDDATTTTSTTGTTTTSTTDTTTTSTTTTTSP
jgi:hypothetical protein